MIVVLCVCGGGEFLEFVVFVDLGVDWLCYYFVYEGKMLVVG